MHRSVIRESSSDAEELSHVDNEEKLHSNSGSRERKPDAVWQDEFNQRPKQKIKSVSCGYASDDSNDSLYSRCWQRAENYVQDFIKEQDAAAKDKSNEDATRATSSSCRKMDVNSDEEVKENAPRISSRRSQQIDIKDRSDTEFSQLTQSSSDESKTYSQVYSEIFEESKARQKKAEKIRKVYNNNNNNNRTRHWVEHIGENDMDDCTTEASDRSDKESEENIEPSDSEPDYESLIKEQLDVIAQYQNDPLGSFRSCIEDYMCEIDHAHHGEDNEKQVKTSRQLEELTKESATTNRSSHSNLVCIKSYSQNLEFESETSQKSSLEKYMIDNDPNFNSTEILHFEHCEIYHVKQSDKCNSKDFELSNSNDKKDIPTEEVFSNSSKVSSTRQKCGKRKQSQATNRQVSVESEQYEERSSEQIAEQVSEEQTSNRSADDSFQLVTKSVVEDWQSQSKTPDHSESSEEKCFEELSRESTESETEISKCSSNHIEIEMSLGTRRRLNKSERASNNSHKSHHLPTTSSRSSRIRSPYEDSTDSTNNYYLSSKSLTSSISPISSRRSRRARSVLTTPKTYEDRACSPIKIKSRRQANQMISNQSEIVKKTDEDSEEIEEILDSSSSTKTQLKQQYSQVSVISEDKGLQYPSENELEDSVDSKKSVQCLKVYDLDKALLEMPNDFKGNAIMFDNEDELLDISLSDDEMQIQAKLQAAAFSDRKKDGSSRNSSYNSISSADRSSICSICSYEPSERFYRRTQAEDDGDNLTTDADDSKPMTYKKHVELLAERALRSCTNYYNEGIKLQPQLDQELNEKVQMLYNSEMRFNTSKRQKKREELVQEFNERLQRQLKSIAPRLK